MKTNWGAGFSLAVVAILSTQCAMAQNPSSPPPSASIPMNQLGAVAGKQYQGDGLTVVATPDGARLRCVFQQLEGAVTSEGLWLSSTASGSSSERFRVLAVKVGRAGSNALEVWPASALPLAGSVNVIGNAARFGRHGLTEEYSVSLDGVRQDFIIEHRPEAEGELRVELDVTGAKVEPLVQGVRLILDSSDRRLNFHRLHVTDANGWELSAKLEVVSAHRMAVVVDDANAMYPVRIDPTFSDANWFRMGRRPGCDAPVRAMTVDSSGNVFIGGDFTSAGGVAANRIVKWDGSNWTALGLGLNDKVWALAVSGTNLYAGGTFTWATNTAGTSVAANYVAKWDGNVWSPLGSGVDADVVALAASGNDVYAGGYFSAAGGAAANHVAKWNGTGWTTLGSGTEGAAYALALSGSDLYVGGVFGKAGGVTVNHIAKWNGTSWTPLGSGTISYVYSIAVSGSDLYAGGYFKNAGGNLVNNIAKWSGSSWSALGLGIGGGGDYPTANTLAVSGDSVYVGGNFAWATNNGGDTVKVNGVGKWDGTNWTSAGSGLNDYAIVNALAASGSNVYVGGDFHWADGVSADKIAKWNGIGWEAFGGYLNGVVSAMATSGSDVYAGGNFTRAGGKAAHGIAKWNGSSWASVASGVNGPVSALAVSGSNLYVGGSLTIATNSVGTAVMVNQIAKWDGSNWSPLAGGMNGGVYALAASGNDLYAGGYFSMATNHGGAAVTVNSIAKWDGSSWSELSLGVDGDVYALVLSGSDLFVGGHFRTAGSIVANDVAKWDGTNWSALGSGIYPGAVYALAVVGNSLYAGGQFSLAGETPVSGIAKWDGTNWFALGAGVGGYVSALAVAGNDLYVGGTFGTVNHIAKWDGSNWFALGSGVGYFSSSVYALAVSRSDLYVGGRFALAGGETSDYAAGAVVNPGDWLTIRAGVPGPNTNLLTYVGVPNNQYVIQFATNLTTSPWFNLATNLTVANGRGVIQDNTATNSQRFYRVSLP